MPLELTAIQFLREAPFDLYSGCQQRKRRETVCWKLKIGN